MQLDKEKQAPPVSGNINKQNEIRLSVVKAVCVTIGLALAIIGLYFLSQFNYLFFHTTVEVFSIVIAFAIFVIGWNSRRIINNNYLIVISVAFLFVGGLALLHSLTYRGLNVFEGIDSNWATQLWLAMRYLLSLSVVFALMFIRRKLNPWIVLTVFSIIFLLLVGSIFFWQLFPTAYVTGQGLTTFKVVSEYVISGILAVAILMLFRNRSEFSGNVKNYLIAAMVALIAAELSFTLYVDVYGFFNLAGHLLNLVAFYLIYKAIIETGLSRPHDLLFFNIKKNEETLQKSEERFRGALDNMIEGCQIIGRDWRYIYINDAAERHNRRPGTELLGNRYMDMWPGIESTEVFRKINECMETGISLSLENFFIYPDGKTGWFDLKINPIPEGVFILSIDITERKKAEEALKESEERYRLIVETANEGIWAALPDGKTTFVNQRMADMLGYRKEEILDHNGLEFIDSQQQTQVFENRGLLKNKNNVEFECKFIRKDGATLWTLASTAPLLDMDGKHIANIAMHTDITDRKKAEEALIESEERFFKAFNQSPIALIITRYSDGLYIDINETFLRLFEYKRSEVIGRTSPELNIFASNEGRAEFLRHFEGGQIRGLEMDFRTKSGKLLNTILSSETINLNGQDHLLTTLVDITERKKAEEALQQSEEQARQRAEELQKLMDIIPIAVWVSNDPECKVIVGNQTANTFYEAELEENVSAGPAKGTEQDFTRRFFRNGKELLPNELPMQEAVANNKEIKNTELDVLLPSGKTMTMLGSAKPLHNDKGEVRGCLATFIDITERKKSEEELKQAQTQLEVYTKDLEFIVEERTKALKDSERLAAIGATAGMVGHDIRNPLQAITGDLYFARRDLAKLSSSFEKQKIVENLSSIETSLNYINKIVQDLQDFARPIKPTIQETDVVALCKELMQQTKHLPTVSTNCQVNESLKKMPVDSLILRRILTNLVTNAIQAMPEGGSVTLEAYREGADAVITVADTGSGISDDVKPKLFTPLMTTKSKGQGFGLAVVKRMTEALGGSVSFESEIGKGTKFIIRLPIKE